MNATTTSVPDTTALVTRLAERIVATITSPLPEAVGERAAARITARVAVLVQAGNVQAARLLVTDEIALASLQAEITRHATDCQGCARQVWGCAEIARMEDTEARLLNLVANAGGLR